MGKDWTIRVIGVKMTADGEPWLICRLVSCSVNPAQLTSDRPLHVDDQGRAMLGYDKSPAYDQVPGCGGIMVSDSEFYRQVAGGCVMCTRPVSLRDAYDLVWVTEGPICPNCDDRLYEGVIM